MTDCYNVNPREIKSHSRMKVMPIHEFTDHWSTDWNTSPHLTASTKGYKMVQESEYKSELSRRGVATLWYLILALSITFCSNMPPHLLQPKEVRKLSQKDTETRCYPVKNPVWEDGQQRESFGKEGTGASFRGLQPLMINLDVFYTLSQKRCI